jgi:hypothetical protein
MYRHYHQVSSSAESGGGAPKGSGRPHFDAVDPVRANERFRSEELGNPVSLS